MRAIIIAGMAFLSLGLHAETFVRAPVEVTAIGFSAVVNDGRVVATWKRYRRDDFSAYLLIKSSTKESPIYPDDPAVLSTNNVDNLQFEDGKISPGTWYYRLCIVTRFGDRWISPVVNVRINPEDLKRSTPTVADFE